uniref:Uncharacterized protein n=1 Tax=Glossina pallidipes TaxID=7398 RepID=A0A1A9ZIG8_GLOPL
MDNDVVLALLCIGRNFLLNSLFKRSISEISDFGSTNRSCVSNESNAKRMETISELLCTPDPSQAKTERSSMPTMPSPSTPSSTILSIKPSFSRPSGRTHGSTTPIMNPYAASEQCGRH